MTFRELSPKQIESYKNSLSRLNIWEGAVRSGKSFSCLLSFIRHVNEGPPGDMVIVGRTTDSLKRNVIGPLMEFLGNDVKYRSGLREIKLWGRTIHVVGANDERAEGKIRGATFAGALVDEITLLPESFFKMLLSRLSLVGSRLFGTTNPDSPFHWLLRDYLASTNPDIDVRRFTFNLNDNPALSDAYKRSITAEYTGLWYQRFIEGKWVLAEGTIFDMFDEKIHVIDAPPGAAEYYVVGIDYGTSNPTAFTMVGYSSKTSPNMWLQKEYYWDSRKEQRQKSDAQYAQDLRKFIQGFNVRSIYLDPSAASLSVELSHQGITTIEANNDVLDGIRYHTTLLTQGTFKVCRNCSKTIEEYQSYRWDPQAQLRGIDKPMKEHDHSLDSLRYSFMSHFYVLGGNRMTPQDLEKLRAEAEGIDSNHGKFFENRMW